MRRARRVRQGEMGEMGEKGEKWAWLKGTETRSAFQDVTPAVTRQRVDFHLSATTLSFFLILFPLDFLHTRAVNRFTASPFNLMLNGFTAGACSILFQYC